MIPWLVACAVQKPVPSYIIADAKNTSVYVYFDKVLGGPCDASKCSVGSVKPASCTLLQQRATFVFQGAVAGGDMITCADNAIQGVSAFSLSTDYTRDADEQFTGYEEEHLAQLNGMRSDMQLGNFTTKSKLQKIARIRADDMVINSYFSHDSPHFGKLQQFLDDLGVYSFGENIATG